MQTVHPFSTQSYIIIPWEHLIYSLNTKRLDQSMVIQNMAGQNNLFCRVLPAVPWWEEGTFLVSRKTKSADSGYTLMVHCCTLDRSAIGAQHVNLPSRTSYSLVPGALYIFRKITVKYYIPKSHSMLEEVGHGHVNHARMSRRGLHAEALTQTSSGHCLVLLSCDLTVLQNFAGSYNTCQRLA